MTSVSWASELMAPSSYDVLADEPVSYVVLKAILGRDMGEPFGTAKTSLGWATCDYSGTTPGDWFLSARAGRRQQPRESGGGPLRRLEQLWY